MRTPAPVSCSRATLGTSGELRVDSSRRAALRAGARPAGGALGGPDRQALLDDSPCELSPLFVVRNGEHGTRVPLREQPALDEAEHIVRKVEQPDSIGHRRLRAPDALCHVAERERELVLEDRVRAGFLDRREVLARDVLDERKQKGVAIVGGADERGNGREAGRLGGAPTALARDQLIGSVRDRPDDDRLDDTLNPDRLGEARERLGIEAPAWLEPVRPDRSHGELRQLGVVADSAEQDLEPAAEPAASFRGASSRSTSSLATL